MQPEQTGADETLEAGAVLRFLVSNPDFFDRHQDILPRLRIPHASGRAISLIEKQVSVLRGKCAMLERSLRDFVAVARDNERTQRRLHGLLQDIVSAASVEEVIAQTRRGLCEGFGADAVHVLLVAPPAKARAGGSATDATDPTDGGYRAIDADDPALALYAEALESCETVCGLPDAAQLAALFGEDIARVGSAAVVPLEHAGTLGLVVLTSPDESRFSRGKGVMFLDQLGAFLSRRLRSLDGTRP